MEPKIEIKEKETERIHVRELEPPSSPRLDPSVSPSSQVKIRLFFFSFFSLFFSFYLFMELVVDFYLNIFFFFYSERGERICENSFFLKNRNQKLFLTNRVFEYLIKVIF